MPIHRINSALYIIFKCMYFQMAPDLEKLSKIEVYQFWNRQLN